MKIFYLRDKNKLPVVCVASEREGDTLRVGIAVFNPNDKFDKQIARKVATGRLKSQFHYWRTPVLSEKGATKMSLIDLIARDIFFPQRAKDAARLWLKEHK